MIVMSKKTTAGGGLPAIPFTPIEGERWADVPGYEGRYAVSDMGRVKSYAKYKCKVDRILRERTDSEGYKHVVLCPGNNKKVPWSVHRLVAYTFIPNPQGFPEVDHVNAVRGDNHMGNLRWATRQSNQRNEITRKRLSQCKKGKKPSEEARRKMSEAKRGKPVSPKIMYNLTKRRECPVIMRTIAGNDIIVFSSIKEAAFVTGIDGRRISDVCTNKRKQAGGFIWQKI